jgi:putative membrane protein
MVALLVVVVLVTSHDALYPHNTVLQHAPTVLLIVAAMPLLRRWPLSNGAVGCIFLFLLLHSLGARYSYSFVPYDDWAHALVGAGVTETFGFVRNHYDRLVHFCFGLLAIPPLREIAMRHHKLGRGRALGLALGFVIAFGAFYEMFEWFLAMVMSPADAEAYNGQQGDMFDSQKDMALAALGAALGCIADRLREPAESWQLAESRS